MAWECGFALTKLPKRYKTDKREDHIISAEYQKITSEAVTALLNVLDELNAGTYKNFEYKFKKIIEKSLVIKKTIDKRATKQMELF